MIDQRKDMFDCIVIGGGPAGLTASIYLARYHLKVALFDCKTSRASYIPCSNNIAGYAEGVSGNALLDRMRRHALRYGVEPINEKVMHVGRKGSDLVVRTDQLTLSTKCVLLATGVINYSPSNLAKNEHDLGVSKGLIRYCPVCDGYEVTDKNILVVGDDDHAAREAIFLRSYTDCVTLVRDQKEFQISNELMEELTRANVSLAQGSASSFKLHDKRVEVQTGVETLVVDTVYPALGSSIRSELAAMCGADLNSTGCVLVDEQMRTSVEGLFAAGDVVVGLDQISNAMGQAGVAATTIRNRLAKQGSLYR